jgi:hypothetical protein
MMCLRESTLGSSAGKTPRRIYVVEGDAQVHEPAFLVYVMSKGSLKATAVELPQAMSTCPSDLVCMTEPSEIKYLNEEILKVPLQRLATK